MIQRKTEFGTSPARRARAVDPAPRGEFYAYLVEKHWRVVGRTPTGEVVLRNRRGELQRLAPDAGNLRRATLLERWRLRNRFPAREVGLDPEERSPTLGTDSRARGGFTATRLASLGVRSFRRIP